MQTARFIKRKEVLSKILDKDTIVKVWRTIVREELRKQDLKDLYDCYDLNYSIKERAETIRNSILKGGYRASAPLIYRIEKKYGVCRHMVLPQPTDALLLQVLSEAIIDNVIDKQPSNKAFYSRARHNVKKVDELSDYGVNFQKLWLKLQKTIYSFSEEKKLIVITDLSNYYDSINIEELNKVLVKYCDTEEVVTDLIFEIIKEISWRPDYLPYSGRGLPTTSLEAVRLMAHAFLYEVDDVMKAKSGDCFTRWMDDIVIGTDTHKESKEIISSVSDMLKSRGLALNLAKTKILTPEEARFHFQITENTYLNSITILKPGDKGYLELTDEIKKRFKLHLKNKNPKYWDKVTKRYITTFGKLKSEKLLPFVVDLYISHPDLRTNLLRYLTYIGYKKRTSEIVIKIINELDVFDDISLYQICYLVTEWSIPTNAQGEVFIREFTYKILGVNFKRKRPIDFYSVIWFMSKYSNTDKLLDFILKYENLWKSEPFLRRQVTAVIGRVYITNQNKVDAVLSNLIASGDNSTVSLALQIKTFAELSGIDFNLKSYLFPQHKQKIYPLPKFLVLCSVLNSPEVRKIENLNQTIKEYISDPYYLKHLAIYGLD